MYGLSKATMQCYQILVKLDGGHDAKMQRLKMLYESNKHIAQLRGML